MRAVRLWCQHQRRGVLLYLLCSKGKLTSSRYFSFENNPKTTAPQDPGNGSSSVRKIRSNLRYQIACKNSWFSSLPSVYCSSDSHKLGFTLQRSVRVSQTHWLRCTDLSVQLPDAAAEEVQVQTHTGAVGKPWGNGEWPAVPGCGSAWPWDARWSSGWPLSDSLCCSDRLQLCSWQLNISFCTSWLCAAA